MSNPMAARSDRVGMALLREPSALILQALRRHANAVPDKFGCWLRGGAKSP